MTTAFLFALLFAWSTNTTLAKILEDPERPVPATVCSIARAPEVFEGRIVRIAGEVQNGPEVLTISQNCDGQVIGVVVEAPDTIEPEARPRFSLEQDDVYDFFQRALSKYGIRLVGGPDSDSVPHRRVIAVLVGRLDGPAQLRTKDKNGRTIVRKGYGNMGESKFRLVLQSVESLTISK